VAGQQSARPVRHPQLGRRRLQRGEHNQHRVYRRRPPRPWPVVQLGDALVGVPALPPDVTRLADPRQARCPASNVSPTSVFAPRLVAVGADLDLVHRADVVVSAESEGLSISLPDRSRQPGERDQGAWRCLGLHRPVARRLDGRYRQRSQRGSGVQAPSAPHPTWLERIRASLEWAPPDQQGGRGDVAAGGTGFASSPVNVRIKISHWPDPTRFCAHRRIHEPSK
jgi:hypothetical protein